MRKIVTLVLLLFVGLTSCAPTASVQPTITYTPSNTITPAPVITPAANQTTNQTEVYSPATSAIYVHVSPPEAGKVSPSSGNYVIGSNVAFTATPADGFVFSSWWFEHTDSGVTSMGRIGSNLTLNFDVETPGSLT